MSREAQASFIATAVVLFALAALATSMADRPFGGRRLRRYVVLQQAGRVLLAASVASALLGIWGWAL